MSEIVVMKFGGTSVGTTERIAAVADRVVNYQKDTGKKVVVVVSAMSGETNRLVGLCEEVAGGNRYNRREYDQLVASGEQASSALTSIAIQKLGTKSQSLLAHQVGIKTKEERGKTVIESIDTEVINSLIENDVVPVLAGFQGVNTQGEFTTLGRGGSDTSAVAVAAALGCKRCVILTDVDGVYSTSPKICKNAKKLPFASYEEMLEMASSGAKVLQTRSVHLARKFGLEIEVCNSFNNNPGSIITGEYEGMEDNVVSGITCLTDQSKITVRSLEDKPGVVAKIFDIVAESGVVVDMIVQNQGKGGNAAVSFTVPEAEGDIALEAVQKFISAEAPELSVEIDKNIAKLAVVGEGMRAHTGIAAKVFQVLGDEGINIDMITTSEIKISVAFDQKYSELAVRALHERFVENAQKA